MLDLLRKEADEKKGSQLMSYGSSVSNCDYIVERQLAKIAPRTVVDFGAGSGKNGAMIRRVLGADLDLTAVEGFEPAANALCNNSDYTHVSHALLQDWIRGGSERYDIAVFGDVLEHLTPSQIHRALRGCLTRFNHVIIVVPLHDIFQDEMYENTLEKHKSYITQGFFDRYKPQEKHIVEGPYFTIMNLRISPDERKAPRLGRLEKRGLHISLLERALHVTLVILNPVGLARPFVDLLKLVRRLF